MGARLGWRRGGIGRARGGRIRRRGRVLMDVAVEELRQWWQEPLGW